MLYVILRCLYRIASKITKLKIRVYLENRTQKYISATRRRRYRVPSDRSMPSASAGLAVQFIYSFCPFDSTAVAGSVKVGSLNLRLITPVE